MSDQGSYWTRLTMNRRDALRKALVAGGGIAALSLVGCSNDDDGGDSGGGGSSSGPAAQKVADQTKGKPGGKLLWMGYGDPNGGLEMIKVRNQGVAGNLAGPIFDGLVEFAYGIPGKPGVGAEVTPIVAQSLPEITGDKLTYVFKIRPGITFHNGRTLTAEDVKWTFDTLAFDAASGWKGEYSFIDSTAAPDASTFTLTTKAPYADTLASLAYKNHGGIMAKEHQLSPEADKKMIGSGAFTFTEYTPPTIFRYTKNPNYFNKPFPYFDSIDRIATPDGEKRVADFISKQLQTTYFFTAEDRDRVRSARPDALNFNYDYPGSTAVYFRTDVKPFDDARVRKALSMAIDRKSLINSITNGEGKADQIMSASGGDWDLRRPDQLGANAKWYEHNLTEAKALLSAAGIAGPIKMDMPTWNATVVDQKHVDQLTLITTQWRNAGIADANVMEMTFGAMIPVSQGNYDHAFWYPNYETTAPNLGQLIRNKYTVPADGVLKAPTLNAGYMTNRQVSDLAARQAQTFDRQERISIFRQMEDLLNGDMWHVVGIYGPITYFLDPALKNAQWPRDAYNGAFPWMKFWWFDKG